MKKNITVVGAGLVGSLLSIYLARRGHNVNVYERRPDMRKGAGGVGKSINLALSDRGWKGLRGLGLEEDIKKIAIPMFGRYIHNRDGSHAFQSYGKEGQAIYSVSRAEINMKLMDLAEREKHVNIHFNERCTHLEKDCMGVTFHNEESGKSCVVNSDLIFGSDGAFSAVRLSHQLASDRFEYQQHYIEAGYKELIIPPGAENAFLMEKNALHIWPRGSFMMIALPNPDGNFTCTLFLPFEGEKSFHKLQTEAAVSKFFEEEFPSAVPLMPTLVEDFFRNPTSSLVTVKCFPWVVEDKLALIGDAAHAIVPFFGQGMNCGFEDCVVFDRLMERHGDDWMTLLAEYQKLRKPDSDAIADMAIENFIEMRDKTADSVFLLQKKIEGWFSSRHPDLWIPSYSMVTFSPEIRYSEALLQGRKQQLIMDQIMAEPGIERMWEDEKTERAILQLLEKR